jgi:hypothetical protein
MSLVDKNLVDDLKQSILNTEYPKLLHESEDRIFKEPIEKRAAFSNFYNKENMILDKKSKTSFNHFINKLLVDTLKDTKNSINVIGGSRSWDNLINKIYKNKLELNKLEKTSIIPGNYDIFCITNKTESVNTIMNKMYKLFDDIITFCHNQDIEVKYIHNYQEPDDSTNLFTNKGNISRLSNNYYSEDGCVFAPCKAMHLEIVGGEFNEKVLIYFELILIKNPKIIHYIRDNILDNDPNNNLNYLNLKGLYLFSELIISRRRDKEFDVDTYRKNILNKLIETDPNFNKIGMYYKIIQIYSYMFRDRTNFNLMRIILTKNFVFLSDKHVMDDYNSYLTENFRKYINSFIIDTNSLLKGIDHKFFITGGDAYRRYIPEIITQTNDIDLKLVYTNKDNYKDYLHTVIKSMSNLIYILYSHKPINQVNSYKINDYISVEFIPRYPGGQFRLRYVESENFTLLSIDYRYRLKININNNSIIVNEEFALLDVVLYHDTVLPKIISDNFIPVASSEYLINDLRKIYDTINQNLYSRFPKNSKDKQRFKNLIEYVQKYSNDIYINRGIKRNRVEDHDIEINNIKKLKIKEFNNNKSKYTNRVKEFLEDQEDQEDKDQDKQDIEDIQTIGENLNISINPVIYDNFCNDDKVQNIINEYSNTFIEKINKNDQEDEQDKVYKIKMSFDDIKIIIAKYITDYSEEVSDISDLLSNVALTEPDTDIDMLSISNKSSPKNKNTDEENIDDIDKMFENLNL